MTMRNVGLALAAGMLLVLLLVPSAFAQVYPVYPVGPVSGVVGYNPNTVQTVTGKIEHVWNGQPAPGLGKYQMFSVRLPSKAAVDVALAPVAVYRQSGIPLKKGSTVTVTGSLVAPSGKPVLLASQIQEGTLYAQLRDASGNPLWLSGTVVAGPVPSGQAVASIAGSQVISGKIEHVWTAEPAPGMGQYQMISVRQPNNTVITVALAPPAFVKQVGAPLKVGDFVTIMGSPAVVGGTSMLIASQVQEGGQFAFRNEAGMPLWSGGQVALYNPTTQQTVSGKIEHVWVAEPAPGLGQYRMISIRQPDNKVVTVALAPSSFIDTSQIPLAIGDPATVTGSLIVANGQQIVLARQLQEGGIYAFRDAAGNPLWTTAVAVVPMG